MSVSSGKPISFTRPDPTQFALLVTRAGRGTGTVVGTEYFKPAGCEWATDEDLLAAGYVSVAHLGRLAYLFREIVMAARAGAATDTDVKVWLQRAEQILTGTISGG